MTLKLRFKSLPHQEQAIENISAVFRGVSFSPGQFPQPNPYLDLSENCKLIEKNIQEIRQEQDISQGIIDVGINSPLNLDIWMETGTGKTFTFLETMYKLNELHSLVKFIILVPSNAIKQGTIKNIQITKEFFYRKYNSKHIEAFDYSSKTVRNFTTSANDTISVLVMTYQSFNKETNTIQKKNLEDNQLFKKQTQIEELAALNPVIIIDEPHRFTGKQTQKFLPSFKPQIIFRFGATFREDHKNLIYILDSAEAFKQSLVKTITVHGIGTKGASKHDLTYKGTVGQGKTRKAIIEYHPVGEPPQKVVLKEGGNIGEQLSVDFLRDCVLEKITLKELMLTNGTKLLLYSPEDYSGLVEKKSRIMLEQTVKQHFKKEEQLFKENIKALSLIFINSVGIYITEKEGTLAKAGPVAKMFEEIYKGELKKVLKRKDLDPQYRKYLERTKDDIGKVHDGYFAISKQLKDQEEIINLILRDKEKLLSNDSDLRFIFSMWALQEGWDNPNIFTLCKLAPSSSTITKLQQIGRGLRLAVKQTEGRLERLTHEEISAEEFRTINKLDVIVPDEEGSFVQGIQKEISESSINSVTDIIDAKVLCRKSVCYDARNYSVKGDYQAVRLLQILDTHKHIELDQGTGKGRIISAEGLDVAIADAKKQGVVFAEEKLKKLFDEHFALDDAVTTQSELNDIELKINKKLWPKFKILWEDINRDSSYNFSINQEELLKNIIGKINSDLTVNPIIISVTKTKRAESGKDSVTTSSKEQEVQISTFTFYEFVKRIADNTKLSFDTIVNILMSIEESKFKMLNNDQIMAADRITNICLKEIRRHILASLKFEIGDKRKVRTTLTGKSNKPLAKIKLVSMGRNEHTLTNLGVQTKSLTGNKMGVDSKIEMRIIDESISDKIEVFTKLPEIRIPIPGGQKYTPDFAYVVNKQADNNEDISYHLIIEAKGYDDKEELRSAENYKLKVAEKFFEALDTHNLKNSAVIKKASPQEEGKRIAYRLFMNSDKLDRVMEGAEKELFEL